ncbi:MAG: serine protease, partial [Chloroflexi bacterium]|nr:serine protease [Chloroflexota bacterium]
MNSPEHVANILRPEFRRVGIGVITDGIHGSMFTQDFTN